MKFFYKKIFALFLIFISSNVLVASNNHPSLAISQSDIQNMIIDIEQISSAKQELEMLVNKIERSISQDPVIPYPKDAGGGYTHERHKENYKLLYDLGILFQLTKDYKYAEYAKRMLFEYSEMYPTLSYHPKRKEQSPGKLFWQSLNEAMWLFYVIQAYDMIVDSLSYDDKNLIESKLLLPIADFLSEGQPNTFNKIHNHGTWAVSSVGMTGYTLNNDVLVQKALYGLDRSGSAGFIKQIDKLFSPDGYYAEGPYYQRFALLPFIIFAKSINNNDPQLEIFEYRNQALIKSVYTTIHLSYNKLFFPINDAIKDKGIDTIELVHSLAIAYDFNNDPSLLSIAKQQDHILLTGYGLKVAKAIENNLDKPFKYKTLQLKDGVDGNMGALSIFRSGFNDGHQTLVMKNTSHGYGHGHFDKLHWLYFDNNNEIISDYGAARFLNIEAKYGGHYLPENNLYAKQTIAHNTLVLNEESQFNGLYSESQKHAPEIIFFDNQKNIKITSAKLLNAYKDTEINRTIAMINLDFLEHPLILDILNVVSDNNNQYDLPLHYKGHLISHSGDIVYENEQRQLGTKNGYQFLWKKGSVNLKDGMSQVTWLNTDRFYTYSFLANNNENLIFSQIGANDKNFNLRTENQLIHRVSSAKNHTFISALETHGEYNPRLEFTKNSESSIKTITYKNIDGKIIVLIHFKNGEEYSLALSGNSKPQTINKISIKNLNIKWTGHYSFLIIN